MVSVHVSGAGNTNTIHDHRPYDLILQALVDAQLIALVDERHALGDAVLLIELCVRLTWTAEG